MPLPPTVLIEHWCALGDSVARAGVRKLVIVNSHGGNEELMGIVARELRERHDMLVVKTSWMRFGIPDELVGERERRFGIHGGDYETSVMLALAPALVHAERAPRHLGVRGGDRQVQDDVDLVAREKLVDGGGAHAERVGTGPRRARIDVGAEAHLDVAEHRGEREVALGDVAATDDADAERGIAAHADAPSPSSVQPRQDAIARRAKRSRSLGASCSTIQWRGRSDERSAASSAAQSIEPCPGSAQPSSSGVVGESSAATSFR